MGTSIAIICISTALVAWSWASYVSYKRVYEELADLNANLIVLRGRLAVLENLEQESRIKQRENLVKQRMFNESLEHQVWCTKKDVDSSMELLGNTKLSCFGKNAKKNKQFDAAMRHLVARRKWATHD